MTAKSIHGVWQLETLNEEVQVRYKQQRSNTRNAMKSLPPVRVFKGSAQGSIWRQILQRLLHYNYNAG